MYVRANYPLPAGSTVPLPVTLGCPLPAQRPAGPLGAFVAANYPLPTGAAVPTPLPLSGYVAANYPLPAGGTVLPLRGFLGCACQGGAAAPPVRTPNVKGLGFSIKDTLIGAGIGGGVAALQSLLDGSGSSGSSSPAPSGQQPVLRLPALNNTGVAAPSMVPVGNPNVTNPAGNPGNQSHQLVPWASNSTLLIAASVVGAGAMIAMSGRRR